MQFSIRVAALLMFFIALSAVPGIADGSNSFLAQNGNRPFLEGGYGKDLVGIDRLNAFYVYAQSGETIQLGSSAMGVSQGDIHFYRPDGSSGTCVSEYSNAAGVGRIHSLEEERNGPGNPGGYVPCELQVDEQSEGLWQISFVGPDPNSWKASAALPIMQPWIQAEDVYTIAAWDIRVRGADGFEEKGRFFAEHLPLSLGDGDASLFLDLYVLTSDGYIYEVGLEGVQSHSLLLFSNQDGFINSEDGAPLYQSVSLDWANVANKSLPGGISLEGPQKELSLDGKIHKLFFSPPSDDLPTTLPVSNGILRFSAEPNLTVKPESFQFSGTSGSGGTFSFQVSEEGRYRIEVDVNENGVWGDGGDVVLHADAVQGMNFVLWDGKGGDGHMVNPVEGGYSARIRHVVGEIHLPFIDIEENAYGIRVRRLNGPDVARNTIYFDDGSLLAPTQVVDELRVRNGIDSELGAHPVLDNFGNGRGIDTWTYAVSDPLFLEDSFFELKTDLRLSATASLVTPALGEPFEVNLNLRNDGPNTTTDVKVEVRMPPHFMVRLASPSKGRFDQATNTWLIDSLPEFSEEDLTLSLESSERGAFDVYMEVVDFQGQDIDSSPDNWETPFNRIPAEDDEDLIQVFVEPQPSIGIAKRVIEQSGDANKFEVTLELLIDNIGNTTLEDIQIVDEIPEAFHGTDYTVSNVSVSAPLIVNPLFDGKTETRLLAFSGNELDVGEKAVISYTIQVIPFTSLGPYVSSAEAYAQGPNNMRVQDFSNDGRLVDPNGNGVSDDPEEDTPTQIVIEQRSAIGFALEMFNVSGRATSFSAQCALYIENLGDVKLENVIVELDLARVFGQNRYDISSVEVDSQLEFNAEYDGNDTVVLIDGGELSVGEKGLISFRLNAYPVVAEDQYSIQGIARAESITGLEVFDFSDSGSDADSNKNGTSNDLGEGDPTIISFTGDPVIGASLIAERVTGDLGGFTGYYSLVIQNLGDVPLHNIQAINNLNEVFLQSDFNVIDVSTIYGIEANPSFDGRDVKNLISSQDIPLYPGEVFQLEYVVEVKPQSYFGPFNNTILVKAQSAEGALTSDLSDSGSEIDPDGDGNPDEEGENDFHELRFAPNAAVGAALAVTNVSGDLKQFNVSYSIFLENQSDVPLHNLSLEQVLDSTFADAHIEILNMSTDSGLILNTRFDGETHTELLDLSLSKLEVGEHATISLEVQVNPTQEFGPYFLGARVEGKTPFETNVFDFSNEGTNPDPNENGNPSEIGENTPSVLSVTEKPVVGATFDVTDLEGDLTEFRARHVIRIENLGDVPLEDVQAEFDIRALYQGADVEVIRYNSRGPISIQEGYNGIDHIQLINANGILAVADTARVEVDVLVKPGGYTGLYSGNIEVSARGPTGTYAFDVSDRGGVIDLNNNGLANEKAENRPTEIIPEMNPSIGIAKMVARLDELSDGTFEIQYSYLVRNLGDVRLTDIRIIEDLERAFGVNGVLVESIQVSENSSLVASSSFNGTDLLDQSRSSLKPGEQAVVSLELRTTTAFEGRQVQSNSIIRATDPAGNQIEDISNDGVFVDPNGNGSAGDLNEDTPTLVLFDSVNTFEFGSWLTDVRGDAAAYTATLKATIANLGLKELKHIQLNLDLTSGMDDLNVQVKNVSLSGAESLPLNANFDGKTSTHLFDVNNSILHGGASVHVFVDVEFSGIPTFDVKDVSFNLEMENAKGQFLAENGPLLPIYVNTSTGEDAGLESNGNLASLLAERMYRRNRGLPSIDLDFTSQSYPLHMAGVDGVHGKGSLTDIENLDLVPVEGPKNSEAIIKTPEDLFGVTNATSVLAIDYVDNDQLVAGLFATTTPAGETYEHSKNICDRLQGGELKHVEIVSIRGYPFVRSTLVHPSGKVDYAISFISYRNEISYLIDSRFTRDEYLVDQVSSGEILNFQIWSYNPSFAVEIVGQIIEKMELTGHVDFLSREENIPAVPSTFVANSRYENGSMFILVKNTPGVTQYRFTGESSRVESGDSQVFDEVMAVPFEYREQEFIPLEIKSGSLFDALLYVSNDYNEDVDQVYVSDGAWGQVIGDRENIEIDVFDILDQGDLDRIEDRHYVERGMHFKGSVKEDMVLFRHFKPGGMPIDLSEFDYVAFTASGQGEIALRLESQLQNGQIIEKNIDLESGAKIYSFRLSEFSDPALPDNSFKENVATALSFVFDGQPEAGSDVELIVQDIFFGKGQPVSTEEEHVPLEFSLAQNYPNPFSNHTTLEFEVPEPAHIQITVYDLLGRKVYDAVNQKYAKGKHKVQISADKLASGMYLYKMAANDQLFIQTMHVVR